MSFEECVDQCGICFGKISNRTVVEACLHSFCSECISDYITVSGRCPTCDASISCLYFDIKDDQTFSTLEITNENVQSSSQEQKIPETIDFIEDSECPICFEEYVDRSTLEGCFHNFCFKCIVDWSQKSKTCPLCSGGLSVIYHNAKDDHAFDVYEVGKDGDQVPETRAVENAQIQPSASNVQPQVSVVENVEQNSNHILQAQPSFEIINQLQSQPYYQDLNEQGTEQNPTIQRVEVIQLPHTNVTTTSSQNSLFQPTPITTVVNIPSPNIASQNIASQNVASPNDTVPDITSPKVSKGHVSGKGRKRISDDGTCEAGNTKCRRCTR